LGTAPTCPRSVATGVGFYVTRVIALIAWLATAVVLFLAAGTVRQWRRPAASAGEFEVVTPDDG
jgi:hypothetical protein